MLVLEDVSSQLPVLIAMSAPCLPTLMGVSHGTTRTLPSIHCLGRGVLAQQQKLSKHLVPLVFPHQLSRVPLY